MNITGGKYNGRTIVSPDERISRPTLSKTRMGVFNSLYSIIGSFDDKSFLDLFGGSGIMGLEAISRGFKEVKVFELNKKAADIIRNNYTLLGLKADLTIGNSLDLLKSLNRYYDVIYVDPPFKNGNYEEIINLIEHGIIVIESDGKTDFSKYDILKQRKYGSCLITYIKK